MTETPTPTSYALSAVEKAIIWDALTVRMSDPLFPHEREQTRVLRELLTDAHIKVIPYQL